MSKPKTSIESSTSVFKVVTTRTYRFTLRNEQGDSLYGVMIDSNTAASRSGKLIEANFTNYITGKTTFYSLRGQEFTKRSQALDYFKSLLPK